MYNACKGYTIHFCGDVVSGFSHLLIGTQIWILDFSISELLNADYLRSLERRY